MGCTSSSRNDYRAVEHLTDRFDVANYMPLIWSTEGTKPTFAESDIAILEVNKSSFEEAEWSEIISKTRIVRGLGFARMGMLVRGFIQVNLQKHINEYPLVVKEYSRRAGEFVDRLGERIMRRIFKVGYGCKDYCTIRKINYRGDNDTQQYHLCGETLKKVREAIICSKFIDPFDPAEDRASAFKARVAKWFISNLFAIEPAFFDVSLKEFEAELKIVVRNEDARDQIAKLSSSVVEDVNGALVGMGFEF